MLQWCVTSATCSIGLPLLNPAGHRNKVRSVLRDAMLGLSFCHGVRIVHADVKPANIFIGDDGTAVLGDFDVSHDDGAKLTHTVAVGTTVRYMAPELRVVGARATKASDVVSFGKTIAQVADRLEVDMSALVAKCTAEESGDRCTTEQAVADDFFRGAAACRSDDWTSADCIIMAHCGGAAQHASHGGPLCQRTRAACQRAKPRSARGASLTVVATPTTTCHDVLITQHASMQR
mmetsp:Transcript_10989/g.34880  ORF Transcript_10989/g.34880 Transcript_10989/m.34880 type:complete len:234 (-) Transcript_10989:1327-2028(-)